MTHYPQTGSFTAGPWLVEFLVEQMNPAAAPAEAVLAVVAHDRLRLVVCDPALHAMLADRPRVAAQAWGTAVSCLRSEPVLLDALMLANDLMFMPDVPFTHGPMLCVAGVDLDLSRPLVISAVRAGDAEVHLGRPLLAGPCWGESALARFKAAKEKAGVTPSDPRRWQVQEDTLHLEDYTCTPLGLAYSPILESWGPSPSDVVSVMTDGALIDSRPPTSILEMLTVCKETPRAGYLCSHGDRAYLRAVFSF